MPHDRPYLNWIEDFDPDGNYLRGKAAEHIYLSAVATDYRQRVEHLRRSGAYIKAAIASENRRQVRRKALSDWESHTGE